MKFRNTAGIVIDIDPANVGHTVIMAPASHGSSFMSVRDMMRPYHEQHAKTVSKKPSQQEWALRLFITGEGDRLPRGYPR